MLFRSDTHRIFAKERQPLQGQLQQAFALDQRHKLLGKAFAAQWPQARARAAAQDDRYYLHYREFLLVIQSA